MAIITSIDLLINRRTKIIATVGPASSSPGVLEALVEAGVNVFRLNMSHGDHAGHQSAYENIRAIAQRFSEPVTVLADLCGPKIRTGKFENGGIELIEGNEITITMGKGLGHEGMVVSQYEALASDVKINDRILLADGLFELCVLESSDSEIRCRVVHGGRLTDNKGMNLPGVEVSAPCMTQKDIEDAEFAKSLGVDFIALSFVRTADDVLQLRHLLDTSKYPPGIIAKIEKPEALENAEEILDVADAIMIARGDLGVELPPEEVPSAQKQLIEIARKSGKPVIVATQMLESMVTHSRPTRAEVTDVSHAVTSGADAVMLSAETAAGNFPVDAVKMMDRVARQAEAHLWSAGAWGVERSSDEPPSVWNSVASAAANMSKSLNARAIIVVSQSGTSAQTISAARPAAPILALTGNKRIFNKMALLWGVVPLIDTRVGKVNPNELAKQVALDMHLAKPGQHVLLVRGFHDDQAKNLPSVTVLTIPATEGATDY
ncbi:MAG: pyruvate kinase [Gammaproteobacteria bacterium]|nr:pyruvate kinase [Gammaproteobacteria bacterium]